MILRVGDDNREWAVGSCTKETNDGVNEGGRARLGGDDGAVCMSVGNWKRITHRPSCTPEQPPPGTPPVEPLEASKVWGNSTFYTPQLQPCQRKLSRVISTAKLSESIGKLHTSNATKLQQRRRPSADRHPTLQSEAFRRQICSRSASHGCVAGSQLTHRPGLTVRLHRAVPVWSMQFELALPLSMYLDNACSCLKERSRRIRNGTICSPKLNDVERRPQTLQQYAFEFPFLNPISRSNAAQRS